jgi:hypothetical protein
VFRFFQNCRRKKKKEVDLENPLLDITLPESTILDIQNLDYKHIAFVDNEEIKEQKMSEIYYFPDTEEKYILFSENNFKQTSVKNRKIRNPIEELKTAESELKSSIRILKTHEFKRSNRFLCLLSLSMTTTFAGMCTSGLLGYIYKECSQYITDVLEPLMISYANSTCMETDPLPLPSTFNPLLCDQYIRTTRDWTASRYTNGDCYNMIQKTGLVDDDNYWSFFKIELFGAIPLALLTAIFGIVIFSKTHNYQIRKYLSDEERHIIKQHAERYGMIIPDIANNNDISNVLILFNEKFSQIKREQEQYIKENKLHVILKEAITTQEGKFLDTLIPLILDYADYSDAQKEKNQKRFSFLSGSHKKNNGQLIYSFINTLKKQHENNSERNVVQHIFEYADIVDKIPSKILAR